MKQIIITLHYRQKHKGRIEYAFVIDSKDIQAGNVLNKKKARVTFPDLTGKLDFNSGFRSSDGYFINGVLICLILAGTRQQVKW
ncbi:MAG TPA: hypothetical protein VJU13_07430 [Candidatus Nitrosocosmicus sp.]|nr:hypothetical protein [Candidatus Nitrosocosmicus sp.]